MNHYNVEDCGRCGSKIIESLMRGSRKDVFSRRKPDGERENRDIRLCSTCKEELWKFIFEESIDRSDKADPIPLQKIGEGVEQYITDLESVLDEIKMEEAKSNCEESKSKSGFGDVYEL